MASLDPSDPSVGKQEMITWLYSRDRTTTLHTKLNRRQLSIKVRQAQPDLFPDPESDAPALKSIHGTTDQITSKHVEARTEDTKPSIFNRASEKSSTRYSDVNCLQAKSMACQSSATGVAKGSKRLASSENNFPPQKRITLADTSVSPAPRKVSKRSKREQVETKAEVKVMDADHPVDSALEKVKSPKTDSFMVNQIDAALLEAASQAQASFLDRASEERKSNEYNPDRLIWLSPHKRRESKKETHDGTKDLMEFPLVDFFESENLVTGREIKPIIPLISLTSSNETRSGVDVFQDERRKEGKLLDLEKRLINLESQVDVSQLQTRIEGLEQQVERLLSELRTVQEEVDTHNDALTRLMTVEEEDVSGSDSESSDL